MGNVLNLYTGTISMMLFYSFAITLMAYSLPAGTLSYVDPFDNLDSDASLDSVGSQVQDSLQQQTNIPLVELGALVFFSGNILIDLLLNFAFAIPQMVAMLINGILMLFNVDSFIASYIQLFVSVTFMVMYFIGLIRLLAAIRSGNTGGLT